MKLFHRHKFTKWEEVGTTDSYLTTLTILERKCETCEKKKHLQV